MTVFQAVIIAIVQGITEFLPISSTGHKPSATEPMATLSTRPFPWTRASWACARSRMLGVF